MCLNNNFRPEKQREKSKIYNDQYSKKYNINRYKYNVAKYFGKVPWDNTENFYVRPNTNVYLEDFDNFEPDNLNRDKSTAVTKKPTIINRDETSSVTKKPTIINQDETTPVSKNPTIIKQDETTPVSNNLDNVSTSKKSKTCNYKKN